MKSRLRWATHREPESDTPAQSPFLHARKHKPRTAGRELLNAERTRLTAVHVGAVRSGQAVEPVGIGLMPG
jgi:hypothetical protein